MDLGFDQSQQMLKSTTREFLERECPIALVRAMEEDPRGFTPELWQKITDLGWLGLPFPQEYGGMGLSYFDLVLLLEETGRALLPGPLFSTVVLGGMTILQAGTPDQKRDLLTRIARGSATVTLALTEPSATYEPWGIQTTATLHDSSYLLNGTKLFVPDAQVVDTFIVATRTQEGSDPSQGITLFLVDAETPGIAVAPLETLAEEKQAEVVFKDVRIPTSAVLGKVDHGWPGASRVLELAAVAKCAEMLGGADRVLEMTVEFAKGRFQFGRPVGSLQAIQHHCANMATAVEGCRYVTYQAAWLLSEGRPATREVAIAKAWVGDAYRRVCALAHQCHGAIGFTKEYDLQLYTRRAIAAEVAYGNGDHYREVVAQSLGL